MTGRSSMGAVEYLALWLVFPLVGMILLSVLIAAALDELGDAVSPVAERAPSYCMQPRPGDYYTGEWCMSAAWWAELGR